MQKKEKRRVEKHKFQRIRCLRGSRGQELLLKPMTYKETNLRHYT